LCPRLLTHSALPLCHQLFSFLITRPDELHPLSLHDALPISKRIRYVNKSGRAYGFHLENAYVEDRESGSAFFVTAVIYANPDGVLNDDDYAYEEMSQPFFTALGTGLARALFTAP